MEKIDLIKSRHEDIEKLVQQNFDKPVKAIIPQENQHTIRINVVGAVRDISKLEIFKKCVPRTTVDGKSNHFLPLPDGLLHSFEKVNQQVVTWLAQSDENAKFFLLDPVTALTKAGIKLQRSDEKQLYRNAEAINDTNLLSPGTQLEKLTVSFKKGSAKTIATSEKAKTKDGGCNC